MSDPLHLWGLRHLLLRALMALSLLAPVASHAQGLLPSTTVRSEQVTASLLAHAPQGVTAGQTVWVGLQLEHAPQWHTYWKNSCDSGLPTQLQWQLPEGVTAGDIVWPTPKKFPLGTLANYGYDGKVLLPVPLTVSPAAAGRPLDIGLTANWLVCRKECIPEEGQFHLTLSAQQPMALHGLAFETALALAPTPTPANAITLRIDGQHLALTWTLAPATWVGRTLEFFPETPGLIEPGAAWTQEWTGNTWSARIPLSEMRSESPAQLPLVLAVSQDKHGQPAAAGIAATAAVVGPWPQVQPLPGSAGVGISPALQAALQANAAQAAKTDPTGPPLGLIAALLGALVGGMVLNLMPCVFPVLAIKVLAFAQHAEDRRAHRIAGLAYTAGVVLSFAMLGSLLLALRAAGEQLGWGFQLQSPAVVAGLATLFTVIALNLGGLFEFGSVLPSSVASLQARHPVADSFLTGVLATAIASPCTAPFMGASLGLAVSLPPVQALAVFATLGVGMALPYLAASWVPSVARALPRPGAWMNTLRQFLAFPMWATVVWLLWVLGQQSGIDGVAALLLMLVVLTLLIWALGLAGRARWPLSGLAAIGLVWMTWTFGPQVVQANTASASATPSASATTASTWEAWTPERQAELTAQGRPVFVDFTAAWCVTCQYNKRTTLADRDVLADMARYRVALLRADWTRRDPAVTQALAQLGRNGVPTYALYPPGGSPRVLAELLGVDEVRSALADL